MNLENEKKTHKKKINNKKNNKQTKWNGRGKLQS